MDVIESTTDPFGGVIPNPEMWSNYPEEFRKQLRYSRTVWETEGFKVVWLEIPISKVGLIPVAVGEGFSFHHVRETDVVLTFQLVEHAFIPPYASHYVGVGGVVVNHEMELLVISERYHRRSRETSYKLPGGALHAAEHIVKGAIREVFEETGIRTRFESLVCFRHWHEYRFGKSDIYFVCRLSPLNLDISMQVEEIEECRWMPVDEYLNRENVSPFNKHIVRAALDSPGIVPTTMEGYDEEKHEFHMPPETR